jgi:hypothetical protein
VDRGRLHLRIQGRLSSFQFAGMVGIGHAGSGCQSANVAHRCWGGPEEPDIVRLSFTKMINA